jgi:2-oxoglutarate ferredoxin oxidoreductase subunit beta
MPRPIGIFRDIRLPTYEAGVNQQVQNAIAKKGEGSLEKLIYSGEVWEV